MNTKQLALLVTLLTTVAIIYNQKETTASPFQLWKAQHNIIYDSIEDLYR